MNAFSYVHTHLCLCDAHSSLDRNQTVTRCDTCRISAAVRQSHLEMEGLLFLYFVNA